MSPRPYHRRVSVPVAALCLLMAPLTTLLVTACGTGGAEERTPAPIAYDRALHMALPAALRARGVLMVSTDASYAPASSFAADGRTIVGFEPDLGAALGKVLGVKVRFTNVDFSQVLAHVSGHHSDLIMSAMTDTPVRERQVDFVNYFSAGTSIVVQRGNPAGISDLAGLCGRVVAVEESTVQVDLISRFQATCGAKRILVRPFGTNTDALVQLRTGRAAAVLTDYPPAAHLVSDSRTRANYQLASTTQYEPGDYGIAVAKDNPKLREAVRAALERLMRSGVYQEVLRRWGVAGGAVVAATVNGGGNVPPG